MTSPVVKVGLIPPPTKEQSPLNFFAGSIKEQLGSDAAGEDHEGNYAIEMDDAAPGLDNE